MSHDKLRRAKGREFQTTGPAIHQEGITPVLYTVHNAGPSIAQQRSLDGIYTLGRLGGVTVRASDLRSSGRGFDSRPGRYQAT